MPDIPGQILVLSQVDSTNAYVKRHPALFREVSAVLADHQTQGKGRQNRTWQMQEGDLAMTVAGPVSAVHPAFGLKVGLAVLGVLQELKFSAPLRLKWPNDILVITTAGPEKLAGILAEHTDGSEGLLLAGVGVNRYQPDIQGTTGWERWIPGYSRDQMAMAIFHRVAGLFKESHLPLEQREIMELDKNLYARGEHRVWGTINGVDSNGHLLVISPAGVQEVHSEFDYHGIFDRPLGS